MTVTLDISAAMRDLDVAIASKDVPRMEASLADYAELEQVPGPPRQRLRYARHELKLLKRAQLQAAERDLLTTTTTDAPETPSPWVKPGQVYDASAYGTLVAAFPTLKWRIISKPGGATMKPNVYYQLSALQAQAEEGDNATERPMWAEKGGIDFDGRARWDAWKDLEGTSPAIAQQRFVAMFYEFSPAHLYRDTRGEVLST